MMIITANSLAAQRQRHNRRRRNRILLMLGLLFITASYCLHDPAHAQDGDTDLGQLSANPYAPDATGEPVQHRRLAGGRGG
jgi:hypothetical protein